MLTANSVKASVEDAVGGIMDVDCVFCSLSTHMSEQGLLSFTLTIEISVEYLELFDSRVKIHLIFGATETVMHELVGDFVVVSEELRDPKDRYRYAILVLKSTGSPVLTRIVEPPKHPNCRSQLEIDGTEPEAQSRWSAGTIARRLKK